MQRRCPAGILSHKHVRTAGRPLIPHRIHAALLLQPLHEVKVPRRRYVCMIAHKNEIRPLEHAGTVKGCDDFMNCDIDHFQRFAIAR